MHKPLTNAGAYAYRDASSCSIANSQPHPDAVACPNADPHTNSGGESNTCANGG